MICVTQSTGWRFPICVIFTSTWGNNPICKKGGKKNKDSYKSSKKGKSSKRDAASSTGKANLAGTMPNDEHADVQDSSATSLSCGQTTTIFWDSTYGAWCYYEQWDTSQDQWNHYVAQEGWNRRSDHHCLEETTISPFGAMLAIIFCLEFFVAST